METLQHAAATLYASLGSLSHWPCAAGALDFVEGTSFVAWIFSGWSLLFCFCVVVASDKNRWGGENDVSLLVDGQDRKSVV